MSAEYSHPQSSLPPGVQVVDWSDLSPEERAALRRVQSEVLDQQPQMPTQAKESYLPHWVGGLAVVGCLFFCFLWWSERSVVSGMTALHAQGTLRMVPVAKGLQPKERVVRVALASKARLRDPGRWSLHSQSTSALSIRRVSSLRAIVTFQRGAVDFHVVPGTMKQFEVRCSNELRVVVKGTRFFIWKTPKGIRVEVSKGHVLVQRNKRDLLHLYAGQGVRLQEQGRRRLATYQVPKTTKSWMQKMSYLAHHQPSELLHYARDMRSVSLGSIEQQTQLLETAAHALQGLHQWRRSMALWQQIYKIRPVGIGAQTALFQAAESCRRAKLSEASCGRLYRVFLKTFPQALPFFRQQAKKRLRKTAIH